MCASTTQQVPSPLKAPKQRVVASTELFPGLCPLLEGTVQTTLLLHSKDWVLLNVSVSRGGFQVTHPLPSHDVAKALQRTWGGRHRGEEIAHSEFLALVTASD